MEDKEKILREKAKTYMVCFHDECPLHERCLRWEVGRYASTELRVSKCVSPRYEKAGTEQCDLYRSNEPVRMPVGMKHFYYDMPAHTASDIRRSLIAHNCRATYYKYHSGYRPITPEYQHLIESVCRRHGWNGPFNYDGEVIDYVW